MITARQFATSFILINASILLLICGLNYWIDVESTHHLPSEKYLIPRTTGQSALSKLYYLSQERPDAIFFGSSRVEVGLPPENKLVGANYTYNAGLSGASLGQWSLFAKHVLSITQPQKVAIGLSFSEFKTKNDGYNFDYSWLLNGDIDSYPFNRFFYDIKSSLSLDTTLMSLKAVLAFVKSSTYDELKTTKSTLGHISDEFMEKVMSGENGAKLFRKRIAAGYNNSDSLKMGSQEYSDDLKTTWESFDSLLNTACNKNILIRLYLHPMHALRTDSIDENGLWPDYEDWKKKLVTLTEKYKAQLCNIKVFDFSGYNNITAEPIRHWSTASPLNYYWEVSHYKSNVGKMILERLFADDNDYTNLNFGRELRQETVSSVLAAIRKEKDQYKISHAEDIRVAKEWISK